MADAQDIAFLRKLIDETNAQPKAQMPGRMSLLFNHPGILTSEIKSEQQYDQDMRRKYFLDRVAQEYENEAVLPENVRSPLLAYKRGEMDDLGSPYQNNGLLQGRSPTFKGFQWWASLPAAAMNAARMGANAIDPAQKRYPDAAQNLAKNINTLTFYGAEDAGLVPKGTGTVADDYAAEKEARGSIPWTRLDKSQDIANLREMSQAMIDRSIPSGGQYLMEAGVPENAALAWGGVMDMMLDPNPAFIGAMKAARAGRPVMGALMKEGGIGLAPAMVPVGVDASRAGYGALQDLLSEEAFAGHGR